MSNPKCKFCGKYANYSLYLAGRITELCAEHYKKAGQKTEQVDTFGMQVNEIPEAR